MNDSFLDGFIRLILSKGTEPTPVFPEIGLTVPLTEVKLGNFL